MGASGWTYFTPHRADVQAALDELRARVFRAGAYHCKTAHARRTMIDPRWLLGDRSAALESYRRIAARPLPQTVAELLERNAESGTHSILDIARVADAPGFGVAAPLDDAAIVERFGTRRPTRAQVEEQGADLGFSRWEAAYVVTYDAAGRPDAICFAGFSGD